MIWKIERFFVERSNQMLSKPKVKYEKWYSLYNICTAGADRKSVV